MITKITKNILLKIAKSRITLALLVVAFIALSIYLFVGQGKVRGDVAKEHSVLVMIDNERKILWTTEDSTSEILKENDIYIYPEDIITTELILDPVTDSGAGQKITITRAPVYHLEVDGTTINVRSWGKTISEVINGKVTLSPRDIVDPPQEANAVPGYITITRINVVETEETVAIPFQTVSQEDYFTPLGTSKILTAGENGSKINMLKITYKNGVETARIILSSKIVDSPTNQVVKKGIMPSARWDFKMEYWKIMVAAGQKYGISPLALFEVASCESHLNPYSQGKYYGMYQYSDGFWQSAFADAGFAGYNWDNATAQIYATAKYAAKYGWGKWGCKP